MKWHSWGTVKQCQNRTSEVNFLCRRNFFFILVYQFRITFFVKGVSWYLYFWDALFSEMMPNFWRLATTISYSQNTVETGDRLGSSWFSISRDRLENTVSGSHLLLSPVSIISGPHPKKTTNFYSQFFWVSICLLAKYSAAPQGRKIGFKRSIFQTFW